MKHYFSTLFALVLLTNQVFAQKTLSPSIKPYAVNWTYTLAKAMNRAGFDMPTMAASATNGVASRSPLQLDSTKTYNSYGLNAPGDSTPLFRTNYTYPSSDTKIEFDLQFENGDWQKISRTTSVSDDQQRLVEVLGDAWDANTGEYKPDSRFLNYPHGNSQELIDSFIVYGWDTVQQDWLFLLATYNTFDPQDRLLESTSTFDYFGTQLLFKDVYFYDANGDNHLIEQYAVFDGFETSSGRTEIDYVDHRPIEERAYVSDGINFFPTKRENYAYELFGALRLHMSFIWDDSIGNYSMTQRIEYDFDGEQRVASKETTIINPGAWDTRELVTYAYVEDENLAQERVYLWNDDLFDWTLDTKKIYYYNNGVTSVDPTPGSAQALVAWPNPTTGLIQLNFDAEADIRVFDATGQLVQSRFVQPGQPMDLTGLPTGIYAVTARQATGFYSGQIVKQ